MLREVVRRANATLRGVRLADPDRKMSHPGKTLSAHVIECARLSRFVAERFGLSERAKRFSEILSLLHDLGKLHPDWELGARAKGFSHSRAGAEILEGLKDAGELGAITGLSEAEQELLIFMVRKHHSALRYSTRGGFGEFKRLRWLEDDPELALQYTDAFGAFKLADFASAVGLTERIEGLLGREWPAEEQITELIGSVDEGRLEKQRRIASCEGHVSLAAPTGWGKTMVGLLKAVRQGPVKLFYALPTITAIRKMKESLEERLGRDAVGEYFYFVDVDLVREPSAEAGEEADRLLDIYRLFIPKVNITTVDQILLTMMRAGRYHMRRFQLRQSVLVLDEYHLLPPPMIGALAEVLSRYAGSYGMRIVLMTATPMSAFKEALSGALEDVTEFDLSEEYGKLRRHRMGLIGDLDEGMERVEELARGGKRVLVILNRVGRAMDFYERLDIDEKLLLHARFTVNDRYEKEAMIDRAKVLVATQVAEVSLDVSFDALVTDLAPIPSIIQRAGRVNRYGERKVCGENVLVMTRIPSEEPYNRAEVKCSLKVLERLAPELSEGEGAYLRMLREYNRLVHDLILREVEDFREVIREKVFEGNQLLALDLNQEKLARALRGIANMLVVPHVYEEVVRELFQKAKDAKTFEERRRTFSEIKGHLVPVKLWSAMKYGRSRPDIPFLVVGGDGGVRYDRELGLVFPGEEFG